MSVEKGFLDAILREPDETTHRLVYADWLEEQGDACRAEFLRLEVLLAQGTGDAATVRARLRVLLPEIGADWLALLDRTSIVNCPHQAACPGQWEKLALTVIPRIRECAVCTRRVQHTRNADEAKDLIQRGQPVAVDSRVELLLIGLDVDPMTESGEGFIRELRDQIARLRGQPRKRRRKHE